MNFNWMRSLSAWQARFLRRSRRPAKRPQRTYKPRAESLEDRWLPAANHLALTGLAGAVAGTAQSVTVMAEDSTNTVDPNYIGTIHFTSTDTNASVVLPANYTFTAGDAGVHTFTNGVKLVTAGNETVTATDINTSSITGTSPAVTITPAAANQFILSGLAGAVAGTNQSLTVTAKDQYGNVATGYTGTVHFTSSDTNASAVLPANYIFQASDAGVHTFTNGVKLVTVGSQTVTATDTVSSSLTGTSSAVAITPAAASQFVLSGLAGTAAGTNQTLTVTAKDQYGNVATGYLGTVHFTSTDTNASAVLPANYTFQASDAGVHTFTNGVKLVTAGSETVTATDTVTSSTIGTSAAVTITPLAASQLALTGLAGAVAGTSQSVTVTAKDQYGNVATSYLGTVHFTSTDTNASVVLPANYTFVAGDAGVHTFSNGVKLVTAGNQTVTATDTVTSSITGASPTLAITAAAASTLVVFGFPTPVVAGTTNTFTVTAKDQYGNVATGYRGTIHVTSTDAQALLPSNYTFTATDNGSHVFGAGLATAATQSITATDTVTGSITGAQTNITVTPAAASQFVLAGLTGAVAGTSQSVTVTAKDPYSNVATGYLGTVHFTSTDTNASVVLPANYTFVAGDAGVHTFTNGVKLVTAGSETVTATDTVTSSTTGTSPAVTITSAAASQLALAGLTGAVAGTSQSPTVTAKDQYGNIATGYLGTVHFTSTDTNASVVLPANYTFTAGDAGVHTFSNGVKLVTAGNQTVTATDTVTGSITATSPALAITPAAASQFALTGLAGAAAGTAQTVTVTAKDPYGNVATGYLGTVHFISTDTNASAVLPANYTFVAGDAGVRTFSNGVKLVTAGSETVTATDTVTGSITGTSPAVTITPAAASTLVVAGFPTPVVAGSTNTFTVTAKDQYGNVATGYTGTVHFASTDPQAFLPGNYTFVAADNGSHVFGAGLATAATQSITATDTVTGSITGTQTSISVTPAAASHFVLASLTGAAAGTAQTVTVIAKDPYNNVATGYTGTVHFTSSDPSASVPANYTFQASDAGVHTFSNGVTLVTAGSETVTATDTVTGSITGTSAALAISPAAASHFVLSGLAGAVAGTSQSLTVTAKDPYNNVATGYLGTVHFTSTDTNASVVLPANYTFVAGDAGVHTFSNGVKLVTAGNQTVTATDTVTSSITATSAAVAITPAAASQLALTGLAGAAAGTMQTVTVTAKDPYGNVATGYLGTAHFTSSDTNASVLLPANYTFVAGDAGVHTFTNGVKLVTAGNQTVTATDTVTGSITGTSPVVAITPGAFGGLLLAGLTGAVAGTSQTPKVTAEDQYGNVATNYLGTVHFTSTDTNASVVLPVNYTFTASDAGVHIFTNALRLVTVGNQTVNVIDTSTGFNALSPALAITPAAASQFALTGLAGAAAGTTQTVTVTAKDPYGNVATGYTGTIHFTSSDTNAAVVLPANYTFVAGDAGVHAFTNGVKLVTAGSQTVTATDTSAGFTGTSAAVTITPVAATQLALSGLIGAVAGTNQTLTVTAKDQYGNVATGYTGTVHFTSSDTNASVVLPVNYTFQASDAGIHAFTGGIKLVTVGNQTVTATDTVTGSITATTPAVAITPAAASQFALAGLAGAAAGTAQTLTVTAKDPYGNVATGYLGTVHFTSTDTNASVILPANYTFVASDAGVHAFSNGVKLVTVGNQTVTATDTVTSSITATSAAVTITPAAASQFVLTGLGGAAAGTVQTLTVTAKDPYGNVATGYLGTVHFTSSDTNASLVLPANYTFVAGDAGVHTFTNGVKLVTAGNQTVTATDTVTSSTTGTSPAVAITPLAASQFVLAGLTGAVAGTSQTLTVTAKDQYGNIATGYTGTVHFTSTDTNASTVLPTNYTFTNGDAGVHTFTNGVKLTTAGNQTVTATDTVTGSLTATTAALAITPAAASQLALTGLAGAVAGTNQSLTVSVKDQYGNVVTSYLGTVHFTSTDTNASAVLPVNYTFIGGDAGVHVFTNGVKLVTAGNQTVTATDTVTGSLTGTTPVLAITPAVASQLALAGLAGAVAGTAQTVTVTAKDPYGNIATGYTGTIHFTSSDTNASVVLPANYTFVAGDAGVHAFSNGVKLVTAGNQTVTATDTVTGSITATSPALAITPAAASQLLLAGLGGGVAGTSQSPTVTVKDQYGNIATGYTGTVHFTSTDTNASVVLPANYTFVAGDAGVHTFTNGVKLVTAGNQTVTATDTVTGSITATSPALAITAAATSQFALTGLAGAAAGTAQTVTVTAKDAYGNVTTGYLGTVHFTSSDTNASAVLPANYTFVAGDAGVHTFTNGVKLVTAGNQTVTATDTSAGFTGTSAAVTITPLAASQLSLTGLSGAVAGTSQSVTVTAKDQYGNIATGYLGTVHFTSSDTNASVVLPANYTFVAGDAGVHTFSNGIKLVTAGNQTVTATDTVTGSITATSPALAITPAAASQFILSGVVGAAAGTSQTLTVTAKDQYGNVATGYLGTVHFTSTDTNASAVLPANYTFVAGDAGVHAFTNGVKLVTAGSQTVTATDTSAGFTGTSAAVTITPLAASQLALTGLAGAVAGTNQSLTVTAKDQYGNVATSYLGTVHFTSTDTNASVVLPANYTFQASDAGVHTFSNGVTLVTAGSETVTATDTGAGFTGTSTAVTIISASASQFVLSGLAGAVAGTNQSLTVTAKDQYGNVATGYLGTVHFTSTDTNASVVLPANYAFQASDAGVHTFSNGVKLVTVGSQTVTATDTGAGFTATSPALVITPAAASQFVLAGLAGAVAGTSQSLTVTAKDPYGNVATAYTGTVHFTSTDTNASVVLPANYTFAVSDAGVHLFSNGVKLVTAGNQTVTATDTSAGFTGTSAAVAITPAAASQLVLTGLSGAVAGTSQSLTVTAKDPYGNVATGYLGTVHFTSSDTNASVVLPANYTFQASDAGVHTFSNGVTLVTAGSETVTATDTGAGFTGTSAAVAITPAAASQFVLSGLAGAVAGTNQSLTVTAKDQYGNVATGYLGTVHFTSTDTNASVVLPANYTFQASDAGVHTFSNGVKLVTAASQTVTATDTSVGFNATSPALAITPAAASQFALTGLAGAVAGTSQSLTVTAKDQYGNVATGYLGTVHFTSTDTNASVVLPANYTFAASDAGVHVFTNGVTLVTAGNQTVTATDTGAGFNGISAAVAITPAAASQLVLTGLSGAVAGTSQSPTLTAKDQYGNVATSYTGTVHFTSSDTNASVILPANYTFQASDAGVHTFSNGVKLVTAGNQTVTANDASAGFTATSPALAITPAAASQLILSGLTGAVAGTSQNLTVTARDQYGNIATGYRGTVHFTSTDTNASVILPANYTFQASDAGVHTFSNGVKLVTAGSETVTATDTVTSATTGTSPAATITPAAASQFTLTGLTGVTAGSAQTVTVTAKDAYGNVTTGYLGTVHFTSSDTNASVVLPANYTFVAGDAGVHTFSNGVTLVTAGNQTVTATDTSAGFTGTSAAVAITPAAASQLVLTGLTGAVAGTSQSPTVTAKDQYGNIATGYFGTVHFTSSDTNASVILPANYTFQASDAGVHTFSNGVKLVTAGTQTVNVTDTVLTAISPSLAITPAAASQFVLSGLAGAVAGTSQTLTVTAKDQYGNVVTGYLGTVHFTSSDTNASVVLPSNYTFVGGDAGVHTFSNGVKLVTAGNETVTATDTVTSSITGTSPALTITPAAASQLVLTGFGSSVTAGTAQSLTVTAKDLYGNKATGYRGTIHFTSTDPHVAGLLLNYTFTAGDAGAHTFANVIFKTAGNQTATATDTVASSITGTSPAVMVTPASAVTFIVAGYISPATAGAGQNVTVTALDQFGNTATGYRGTVHFTSTDGQASLPSDYAFQAADNGIHTFSITLKTAATQSITATDTVTGTLNGSEVGITITAAAATTLIVAGFTSPTTAGITQTVLVTAQDAYGNVATGYTGTIHFTSSDPQAQLSANYTFLGSDNGMKGFTATLKTAGAESITATDTTTATITGTQASITITPAAASALSVGGFTSPTTAGVNQNLTVTARDPYGNVATSYTGTVHFTSTDAQAALPADYTFGSGDNGVHTFSSALKTAGTESITATDTGNASFTATQSGISVRPAAISRFTLAGLSSAIAGASQSLTVTARDAFGNVVTNYTGTVHFTSTDAQASLPANYTFTGGDAGIHTFSITLKTAGLQSVAATDTVTSTATGTQTGLFVIPAAASSLSATGLSGTNSAGSGQSVTVTLRDAFGNLANGYRGTVHFTSTDAQASLPADYTFTGFDGGVHTFNIAFKTVGSQSVTAIDTVVGTLQGTSNVQAVVPAVVATFRLGAPTSSIVGNFFSVTLTAFDAFGNVVTGYTGTVHWSSSDATALLPADYTFTATDAGRHTFAAALAFRRLGTPTVTATDTANAAVTGNAAVTSSNPLEELFVLGADNQVYGQKLDPAGNPVGGYFLIGPGQVSSLSVAHDASGRPEVFVLGLDHQVYAHQFDANGNPVGNYFPTQPGQVKSLAIGRDAIGRPEMFVLGTDNQVYALKFDANGNPVGNYMLTAPGQVRSLAVGREAFGQPEVFAIGLDNQVYAEQFDTNGNATGGFFLTQTGQVKSLSVGEDAAFNPEVFAIGMDNQVYAEKIGTNGTAISPYFLTQPGQVTSLSVGQDANFNPEVFVMGLDSQVYAQRFDANDNSASGYFLAQPGHTLSLQVGQDAANRPELFVTGLDNQVYGAAFNADGTPLGGYFLMQAGAIETFSIAL